MSQSHSPMRSPPCCASSMRLRQPVSDRKGCGCEAPLAISLVGPDDRVSVDVPVPQPDAQPPLLRQLDALTPAGFRALEAPDFGDVAKDASGRADAFGHLN